MRISHVTLTILVCLGLLAPCPALAKNDKAPKTPPGQVDNPGKHKGPPDHAKAWGQRNKFKYYPGANAYFDPAKGLYFYPGKDGWKSGKQLPGALNLKLGAPVDIEVEGDAPYRFNNDHVIKFKAK